MSKLIALVYQLHANQEPENAIRNEFAADNITFDAILTKICKKLNWLRDEQKITTDVGEYFKTRYQMRYVGDSQKWIDIDEPRDFDTAVFKAT